ncbi:hypothetical protein AA0483_1995 [Acetobacter syzygii NRIC 0483]|nr:hypothetical protein AA0483_1995 [Acetobacter syzygii NRIC 0483]
MSFTRTVMAWAEVSGINRETIKKAAITALPHARAPIPSTVWRTRVLATVPCWLAAPPDPLLALRRFLIYLLTPALISPAHGTGLSHSLVAHK